MPEPEPRTALLDCYLTDRLKKLSKSLQCALTISYMHIRDMKALLPEIRSLVSRKSSRSHRCAFASFSIALGVFIASASLDATIKHPPVCLLDP